ncbi:MAG: single-stranded DNA-binding protein [Kiritimatiellia bacterium]
MNEKTGRKDEEGVRSALAEASKRLEKKMEAWRGKYEEQLGEKEAKMTGFNRVVLMGRLTKDPELKEIGEGRSVTNMSLAVTETYKKRDGEFAERVCFIDTAAWGKRGEACARYLKKGSPVLVEGRLRLDRWEASDGTTRSKHRVRADRVQFLNTGSKKEEPPESEPVAAGAAAEPLPF